MKKRILFTGGSGKAGRHVIPWLIDRGYEVHNIDLVPLDKQGVTNLIVDITDSGQVFNALSMHRDFSELESGTGVLPYDAVIHFAAVPRILIKPDNETFRINTMGTYNVIEAAVKLACRAANVLHAVAGELMLQHLDFMIERDEQTAAQIVGVDLLLDAIGTAVKTALAPAGEIERGFAQGLGRDGAGMHGNTADTAAFLDDQNLLFELGGLDGGPSSRRTAADNNQIELVHEKPRNRIYFDTGCRIRRGVVAKWS